MAAGLIDVNKPGKYPIVLSDALLGKTSKETYTGVRYNHKATPSSDSALDSLRLRPSDSSPAGYDLSVPDGSDQYEYTGVRTSGDGKYVLIFDPAKKHFVLHRIDSTFDMNLVSSPWEQDPAVLRTQYEQLEKGSKSSTGAPLRRTQKATKNTPAPKAVEPKRRKSVQAKKAKPSIRQPTPEEEDSDDGLTIEYPDAPGSRPSHHQPTPTFQRDPSEEVSDEDEDAEGEDYESERNQDVDHLKLPSPAAHNAGGISDEDLEQELEAELEAELEQGLNGGESSESEEE